MATGRRACSGIWLSDKRLQLRHIRAGYGDTVRTGAEYQLIAVGIALGSGDIVHIDDKRTVALEDVLVGFQFIDYSSQRGMNLQVCRLAVFQIADRNIILLRLNIKQAVDGNRKVILVSLR